MTCVPHALFRRGIPIVCISVIFFFRKCHIFSFPRVQTVRVGALPVKAKDSRPVDRRSELRRDFLRCEAQPAQRLAPSDDRTHTQDGLEAHHQGAPGAFPRAPDPARDFGAPLGGVYVGFFPGKRKRGMPADALRQGGRTPRLEFRRTRRARVRVDARDPFVDLAIDPERPRRPSIDAGSAEGPPDVVQRGAQGGRRHLPLGRDHHRAG